MSIAEENMMTIEIIYMMIPAPIPPSRNGQKNLKSDLFL